MALKEFIAQLKTDGMARSNYFDVELALPFAVARNSNTNFDMRKILLFCEAINLPSVNISTTQIRTFGELRETPYDKLFDTIQLSFYVDTSMNVKLLFDTWINSIQDPVTRKYSYYNTYTTDVMKINVLDKKSKTRYSVSLFEAYPKSIGAIQLDQNSKDIMKLNVTMIYKYIKTEAFAVDDKSPKSTFPFFDSIKIPTDYFSDFSGFQNKFQTFTGELSDFATKDTIGSVASTSSLSQNAKDALAPNPLNTPDFGDNLGFDFT